MSILVVSTVPHKFGTTAVLFVCQLGPGEIDLSASRSPLNRPCLISAVNDSQTIFRRARMPGLLCTCTLLPPPNVAQCDAKPNMPRDKLSSTTTTTTTTTQSGLWGTRHAAMRTVPLTISHSSLTDHGYQLIVMILNVSVPRAQ